jgi:AAA domain
MPLDFSRKPPGFNTVTKARQFDELKAVLLRRAEDVCHHLYPNGRKEGPEWCVGSVNGDKGHSFKINLKTGIWKEFDGGPGGNDMIALWALAKVIKQGEAYDEAAAWLGWETGKPKTVLDQVPSSPPMKPAPPTPVEEDDEEFWWLKVKPKRWEYLDGNGVPWVTVRRWDKGDGTKRVRPWDPREQDEKWPEGLRPLFNLQQITTARDLILLVEGEKCADALIALGYTATTMAGGAGMARKVDWSPLKNRDVIRWADNDLPGASSKSTGRVVWEETTLAAMQVAGVRSIRDVTIPAGKPDGWDCADAEGKEIERLIEEARNSDPLFVHSDPLDLEAWDVGVCYDGKAPEMRWLVENVIPLGKGGLLAAQGDAGKSMILLDLAMKVATPQAPGFNTNPPTEFGHKIMEHGSCVLFMAEDDRDEIHRRLEAFDPDGSKRQACKGRLFIVPLPDAGGPPKLITGDDRNVGDTDEFEAICKKLRAIEDLKLVVFDPTTPFVGGDMNKPHIAGTLATMIAQLAAETGATVICTHHMTKGERSKPITTPEEARHAIRGAAAYVDGLRFALALWPMPKEETARRIMNGFGREWERNSVYQGAVVKINSKADREPKVFVRSPNTGLLQPKTKAEISEALAAPMHASDEAMIFFLGLVKWHMNKGRKTVFGTTDRPFSYYLGKGTKPSNFVPMPETDWKKLASELGLSKPPSKLDVGRAAKIIASEGPHPLCPLELTPKGFDHAKSEG